MATRSRMWTRIRSQSTCGTVRRSPGSARVVSTRMGGSSWDGCTRDGSLDSMGSVCCLPNGHSRGRRSLSDRRRKIVAIREYAPHARRAARPVAGPGARRCGRPRTPKRFSANRNCRPGACLDVQDRRFSTPVPSKSRSTKRSSRPVALWGQHPIAPNRLFA